MLALALWPLPSRHKEKVLHIIHGVVHGSHSVLDVACTPRKLSDQVVKIIVQSCDLFLQADQG